MLKILFLIIFTTLMACSGQDKKSNAHSLELKPQFRTNVVYGEDNRKDWYEVLDSDLKEAAKSTLGIFDNSSVQIVDDFAVIDTRISRLCPTEKFHQQERGPFCSGFLVGPDLVLTAGHCVETDEQCGELKFVFDYAKKSKDHDATKLLKKNVYSCEKLLSRDFTRTQQDWALIKLDRPVLDRSPLQIERTSSPIARTPLTLIGHPSGLPSKIARGGIIHNVSEHYFVADLDSFGGNSGSAVLNANTLKVEGLLVRGRTDYKNVNGCLEVNVCEEGIGTKCKFPGGAIEGEHATKTFNLKNFIPPLEVETPDPDPEDPIEGEKWVSSVKLTIPDSSLETVFSTIKNVPALNGSDLKIRISIEHSYISDLRITLISPRGTRLTLHGNTGRGEKNIVGVYGQNLVSAEPLSKLEAQPSGKWSLELTDQAPFDKGHLIEWEIIPSRQEALMSTNARF